MSIGTVSPGRQDYRGTVRHLKFFKIKMWSLTRIMGLEANRKSFASKDFRRSLTYSWVFFLETLKWLSRVSALLIWINQGSEKMFLNQMTSRTDSVRSQTRLILCMKFRGSLHSRGDSGISFPVLLGQASRHESTCAMSLVVAYICLNRTCCTQ